MILPLKKYRGTLKKYRGTFKRSDHESNQMNNHLCPAHGTADARSCQTEKKDEDTEKTIRLFLLEETIC